MEILTNPRNAQVVAYFTLACAASRAHSAMARAGYLEYGEEGPLISGCEQSHWPEFYKDTLRELARICSKYCDKAYAARPARMHRSTVTLIGRHVASRDGVGRYGPSPI